MKPSVAVLFILFLALAAPAQVRRRAVHLPAAPVVEIRDDFRFGDRGWVAGFADYSTITTNMELDSGIRPLPQELGISGTGFMIAGNNHSDDLFMFLKKKLTAADGIRPRQRYVIAYVITMASNATANASCAGIGGHPGLSVYLKAGGSAEEPRAEVTPTNEIRMNVDKGNQSTGGPAATVAGNIGNDSPLCSNTPYRTIVRTHVHSYEVESTPSGELWLLVGTDSGFEGKTVLYYQSINATLTAGQ